LKHIEKHLMIKGRDGRTYLMNKLIYYNCISNLSINRNLARHDIPMAYQCDKYLEKLEKTLKNI